MADRHILSPYYLDRPVPYLKSLARPDWLVQETVLNGADQQERMNEINRPLADAVASTLRNNERPVVMSSNCCATIGVVAGLQRAGVAPTLLWLDAHGDFNTWETTPSGFLGGMPLAMIVGLGEMGMPEAVGLKPLDESKVVLTDGRDLDPGERVLVETSAIAHVPDVQDLIDGDLPSGSLYVHFDADILPAEEAPAQNYPVPGGASSAVIGALSDPPGKEADAVAVALSTWHPERDDAERRSEAVSMATFNRLFAPA